MVTADIFIIIIPDSRKVPIKTVKSECLKLT